MVISISHTPSHIRAHRAESRRCRGDPTYRRRWERDHRFMEKAYQQFDSMAAQGQLHWLLQFRQRDLPRRRGERIELAYQLRALAQIVGLAWRWRRRLEPLSDSALKKIHGALRVGLAALDASKRGELTDDGGWRVPPHRVVCRRAPAPADEPNGWTPLHESYTAADEVSAIVAAFYHFLRRHESGWRYCGCGCGEPVTSGKKKGRPRKYLNRQHQNRVTQRMHYRKRKLERRSAKDES